MSFGELALIMLCGLLGPLLAGLPRLAPPVVVGELLAGVIVGRTGFDLIDTGQPTLRFLSDVGFALLMFAMGAGLPLRDPRLRQALARGTAAVVVVTVLALPAALAVAALTTLDRPLVLLLLLMASSAALAVPALTERRLVGTADGMVTVAWVSVANVAAIAAIPVVVSAGSAREAVVGSLVVAAATVVVFMTWHAARQQQWFRRYRKMSKKLRWGLDLRIALVVLFTLSWLAVQFGTSVLVAGFSAGVVVALIGRPNRLAWEVLGLAGGFLVPLFFVTLGARIDLRALLETPRELALAGLLLLGMIVVHVIAAAAVRLPMAAGLVATAQIGVPAAVVAVGLQEDQITPAQGAAILAAALGSAVLLAVGIRVLVRQARSEDAFVQE